MAKFVPHNGVSNSARRGWWLFMGMCALAVVWTAARLGYILFVGSTDDGLGYRPPMSLSPSIGMTDQGTRIQLYECTEEVPADQDPLPKFAGQRIATGPSDPRANCHGWTFTGGKYFVPGEFVETIVRENRYEPVAVPQVGDLVVWRDSSQFPVHTGIVKAVGRDDFVLVESKWGHKGRYLHEPRHPGYSENFTYYRSPRSGHLLRIEPAGY